MKPSVVNEKIGWKGFSAARVMAELVVIFPLLSIKRILCVFISHLDNLV